MLEGGIPKDWFGLLTYFSDVPTTEGVPFEQKVGPRRYEQLMNDVSQPANEHFCCMKISAMHSEIKNETILKISSL